MTTEGDDQQCVITLVTVVNIPLSLSGKGIERYR